MDRLAFKSTANRTAEDIQDTVESLGGNVQCVSSRESMMYQAATFNNAIGKATELLAETIQHPQITSDEIAQELKTAEYEIQEIWRKPELILPELVHMAAFKDNTLGNPLLCPMERVSYIDKNVIKTYRESFYRPERTVVAFAGIPHAEAVELATEFFGDFKGAEAPELLHKQLAGIAEASETLDDGETSQSSRPASPSSASSVSSSASSSPSASSASSASSQSSGIFSKIPFLSNLASAGAKSFANVASQYYPTLEHINAPAHYTGGFVTLPPQPGTTYEQPVNFNHVHLAFEGLPVGSEDIYALATLNTLLGGGGSFSAGGPGKGMYSRLYTNVLNQHAWVENCIAFNHSYTDSGLFGISAQCNPGQTSAMLDVMCQQLRSLTLVKETSFSASTALAFSSWCSHLRKRH